MTERLMISLQTPRGYVNLNVNAVTAIGAVFLDKQTMQHQVRPVSVSGSSHVFYVLNHKDNLDALGFVGPRDAPVSVPVEEDAPKRKGPGRPKKTSSLIGQQIAIGKRIMAAGGK